MKTTPAVILLYFAVLLAGASAAVTWSGAGANSNWFNTTNWAGGVLPGATDDVFVVTNGTGGPILTGSVAILSLTISNKTLTFQGTNTILAASNVMVAGASGKITHSANTDTNGVDGWQADHGIWIQCTNVTVDSGGAAINADAVGYRGGAPTVNNYVGCGPGGGGHSGSFAGRGGGGGCGGAGGAGSDGAAGGSTNGAPYAPFDPGSGGGADNSTAGGIGGGAIRIEASGAVAVNGTISANGGPNASGQYGGGGSGGGIFISCGTFGGSGVIQAVGAAAQQPGWGGGGGGGRIAVYFAQTSSPSVQFSASGGNGYNGGRPGTLVLSAYNGVLQTFLSVGLQLMTNAWAPSSLTLSNSAAVLLLGPGFHLNVTGAVQLLAGARVELGTNAQVSCASLLVTNGSSLLINTNTVVNVQTGHVTLASASATYVYPAAGFTNVANLSLQNTAALYLYCHPTSGVAPLALAVSNLTVAAGTRINADYRGYGSIANLAGYGPGGGGHSSIFGSGRGGGGGYGGRGGNASDGTAGGATNGDAIYPYGPGSGGGADVTMRGGYGGGAIRIAAAGTLTNNGTLSANGEASSQYGGGGSGGGIDITCWAFEGTGTVTVAGGSASTSYGGGGGGGRVSVHYVFDHFYGTYTVSGGIGYNNVYGGSGSVYRCLQEGYLNLTVDGSPQQHGVSTPYVYGSSGLASNSVVTNSVSSPADETHGVRYACFGWAGSGSVPTSGATTQAVFTITNNSTLTWLWTNQYYLTTTSGPNGSLAADMAGWYTNGKPATVTANPSNGYHFTLWSGDVPFADRTNNPLTVTMDQVRAIQANFAGDTGGAKTWVGASSNWYSAEHWSPPGAPGEYDAASITSAVTVTLSDCASVLSLLVSNATLAFLGTNTILTASNLTVAGASGKITHGGNTDTNAADGWRPDAGVWIVCTNLAVAGGAAINVSTNGYRGGWAASGILANGCGPGGGAGGVGLGRGGGGGYGGRGTTGDDGATGGPTNGSPYQPFGPGSGGGSGGTYGPGGNGGGSVRIEAGGVVTVDGTITANGADAPAGSPTTSGAGSGGGIYISCGTLSGTGVVQACGGAANTGDSFDGGGGGGGRIAVYFTNGSSSAIRFLASGGIGNEQVARPGTLCLSAYNDVLPTLVYGGLELMTNAWSPANLVVSNTTAILALGDRFHLAVSGAIELNAGGRLELGTNASLGCTNLALSGNASFLLGTNGTGVINGGHLALNATSSCSLSVGSTLDVGGGNVTLDNKSQLFIYYTAGLTNVADFSLLGSSTNYWYCHSTSAVTPNPLAVRHFTVAAGSRVNADYAGYSGGAGGSVGCGPGGGGYSGFGAGRGGGGGYGGRGGNGLDGAPGGATNGDARLPFGPGSGGGGGDYRGGNGGGVIRVRAGGTATINGSLTANGEYAPYLGSRTAGAGSGGGIYLQCVTISGTGTCSAAGGDANASYGGAGGGGRIAFRCLYNHFYGTCSVVGGTGYQSGQTGSVYWRIQGPGTVISVR